MPEAGDYLLTGVGFSKEKQPFISLYRDGSFTDLQPLNQTLTLRFTTDQRFCIGWRDIAIGQQYPCPDSQLINKKYEQCPACQNRTGFNPAFYHATSVSKQQEARNAQPHFLYLAHFGKGIVKVGISHAARGHSRLLEQGSRMAIILETFATAQVARHYEAKIAALPGIAETIQLRKKIDQLAYPYDPQAASIELLDTKARIEQSIGQQFKSDEALQLDAHYFPSEVPRLSEGFDCSSLDMTSGKMIGALGSLFFFHQQDTPLFLPLKKYIGYKLSLSHDETPVTLPARQISLF